MKKLLLLTFAILLCFSFFLTFNTYAYDDYDKNDTKETKMHQSYIHRFYRWISSFSPRHIINHIRYTIAVRAMVSHM